MWHVWTINTKRYKQILEFLKNLETIEDVLIPVSDEEVIDLRSGLLHTKRVPIYGNYIFIKYSKDDVLSKLVSHPFFYKYLGTCSDKEINFISVRTSNNEHMLGLKVKVLKKPFKHLIGVVSSISGTDVHVLSELDRDNLIEVKCGISEVAILGEVEGCQKKTF